MPILNWNEYIGSLKQMVIWNKTASRTSIAFMPFSVFDLAGQPGAGALAIGNTANGVVPTDLVAGYPVINDIQGANIGYLSRVQANSPVACRLAIYDRVFAAGAYAFNANVTLATQPSYAARIPGGDFKGTELWLETVTAFTGNQSIQILYQDQDNAAGDTGVIATGIAPTIGRMFRMPLAAGDNGVQRINQVISSVATVGTFNVCVMRKLWEGRILSAGFGLLHGVMQTGMPQVFGDSAIFIVVFADGTATSTPTVDFEICQG